MNILNAFSVIVINDYKMILDTMKQDAFLGRPDFQSWEARNEGKKNRGILFSDGIHSWSEQRRFTLRTLRDFGFGKQSMEGLLQSEMEALIQNLK
jgi:methyl farnesoate epoxidase/farnesoate epoxidase